MLGVGRIGRVGKSGVLDVLCCCYACMCDMGFIRRSYYVGFFAYSKPSWIDVCSIIPYEVVVFHGITFIPIFYPFSTHTSLRVDSS